MVVVEEAVEERVVAHEGEVVMEMEGREEVAKVAGAPATAAADLAMVVVVAVVVAVLVVEGQGAVASVAVALVAVAWGEVARVGGARAGGGGVLEWGGVAVGGGVLVGGGQGPGGTAVVAQAEEGRVEAGLAVEVKEWEGAEAEALVVVESVVAATAVASLAVVASLATAVAMAGGEGFEADPTAQRVELQEEEVMEEAATRVEVAWAAEG
jgi:hypothetical protein